MGGCSCTGCASPYSISSTRTEQNCFKLCDVRTPAHAHACRASSYSTCMHAAAGQQVCDGVGYRSAIAALLQGRYLSISLPLLQVTSHSTYVMSIEHSSVACELHLPLLSGLMVVVTKEWAGFDTSGTIRHLNSTAGTLTERSILASAVAPSTRNIGATSARMHVPMVWTATRSRKRRTLD